MLNNYEEYKVLIEDHLKEFLPNVDKKSETLRESMQYSLVAGGKRLRPVLLLAACQLVGGNIYQAVPYACALEFIHTYSLIHDDLPAMDNDDMRRGQKTNHVVYGDATAILAGDGLLNSAFEVIFKDMYLSFDNFDILKRKIRAANAIASASGCKGMIAGQLSDIESEGKVCSNEMLEFIHINKTGALIEAALTAGAYLGGATNEQIKNLSDYGQNLGLAFQITDDILDINGCPSCMGKNAGVDEAKGKCTYITLNGLEKSSKKLLELKEKSLAAMEVFGDDADFFRNILDQVISRDR